MVAIFEELMNAFWCKFCWSGGMNAFIMNVHVCSSNDEGAKEALHEGIKCDTSDQVIARTSHKVHSAFSGECHRYCNRSMIFLFPKQLSLSLDKIAQTFENLSSFLSLSNADDGAADDAKTLLGLAASALPGLYFHCDKQFVEKAVKLCVDV